MPISQTIGLEQLSEYFHLPINEVAKDLGVCATVLKKICRRNGIPRWPHRKIKSLDKMIKTLETTIAKKPEDEDRIKQEITTLRNKKMFLMKNPNALMKGSKTGSNKYKSTVKSPTTQFSTTTSSTSLSSPAVVTTEKMEWNPPTLMNTDFNGTLQQEEAAKSLLNVFASLSHKLQDQPNDAPTTTEINAWNAAAMEPHFPTVPPTETSMYSLKLPKIVFPEESSTTCGERKLTTMEPNLEGSSATPLYPTPYFAMTPRQEIDNRPTLPHWFLREKEQYSAPLPSLFGSEEAFRLQSITRPSSLSTILCAPSYASDIHSVLAKQQQQ